MGCGLSASQQPSHEANQKTYPVQPQKIQQQVQQPHHQPQPTKQHPSAPPAATHVQLDKALLLRYVEVEKRINHLEAKNVVQMLQLKWDELKASEDDIKKLTAIYQSCLDSTKKEKKDVDELNEPSVQKFFHNKSDFENKLSKEQEEYLEALNKQEFAYKKLQTAIQSKEETKISVKQLHVDAEELQKLYKEQDVMLGKIFDGKYGSENEYRLERENDIITERQQRVSAAKARWQAAKLLIDHANKQLGYASQRWDYIAQIPVDGTMSTESRTRNGQMRYHIATEVRNYLIAASTNIRNSHNYLKGIEFPYCKPDETSTLERATNNIFTDLGTRERHSHAANVYRSVYQRSAALLQWFDAVIDKTIDKDLLTATEELFEKKKELRRERVRLIKEKLAELVGHTEAEAAGLDEDANLTDARRLQEQMSNVNKDELQKQMESVNIVQPERVDEAHGGGGSTDSADLPPLPPENEQKPEVIPLKDLAPPPSQNQLFGDIDSLKKQYEIDMEEFSRAQEVNRARVEQGLQEKLAARKSRKARKLMQEQETDKLLIDSANVQ